MFAIHAARRCPAHCRPVPILALSRRRRQPRRSHRSPVCRRPGCAAARAVPARARAHERPGRYGHGGRPGGWVGGGRDGWAGVARGAWDSRTGSPHADIGCILRTAPRRCACRCPASAAATTQSALTPSLPQAPSWSSWCACAVSALLACGCYCATCRNAVVEARLPTHLLYTKRYLPRPTAAGAARVRLLLPHAVLEPGERRYCNSRGRACNAMPHPTLLLRLDRACAFLPLLALFSLLPLAPAGLLLPRQLASGASQPAGSGRGVATRGPCQHGQQQQ